MSIVRRTAAVSAWICVLAACASFGSSTTPSADDAGALADASSAAPSDGAIFTGSADARPFDASSDASSYPPGGDFEQNLPPGSQCGDWTIDRASATKEVQPGYMSNGACRLCADLGPPSIDVWMSPNTWLESPPLGTTYNLTVWVKLETALAKQMAYPFFETSSAPTGPPSDHPEDKTLSTDWLQLRWNHTVMNGEQLLYPGLHLLLDPGTCADVDDFSLTVAP